MVVTQKQGLEIRLDRTNQFTRVMVRSEGDDLVITGELTHKLTEFEFRASQKRATIGFYQPPTVFPRFLLFAFLGLLAVGFLAAVFNSLLGFDGHSLAGNLSAVPGLIAVFFAVRYGWRLDERKRAQLGPRRVDGRSEVMDEERFPDVLTPHQWVDVLLEWCDAHRRKFPCIDGGGA